MSSLYVVLDHYGAPIRTGTGPRATAKIYRSLPTALAAAASKLASVVREVTLTPPECDGVCTGFVLIDAAGEPVLSGALGHRTIRLFVGTAHMAKPAMKKRPGLRLAEVYLKSNADR